MKTVFKTTLAAFLLAMVISIPLGVSAEVLSLRGDKDLAADSDAFDRLFDLLYDELREMAHRRRQAWRGDYTLNTTALVHEAYLKLAAQQRPSWENRAHFMAAASKAIQTAASARSTASASSC